MSNNLTEILLKFKDTFSDYPLTFNIKYHEDIYHIDDLQHPEQHDKIFYFGSARIFSLEINLTKNTFVYTRLAAPKITGEVTKEDKELLINFISKYVGL